jgi:hypothetical protein
LRIPERRHDENYFSLVASHLQTCELVTTVQSNSVTASIVITHRGDIDGVSQFASASGLFSLSCLEPAGDSALRGASGGLRNINSAVQQMTNGVLDAPSLVYAGLVGLALVQTLRGQVVGPATTLLWNALTLMQLNDLSKQVTRTASRNTSGN